jgi:hypothetical protein
VPAQQFDAVVVGQFLIALVLEGPRRLAVVLGIRPSPLLASASAPPPHD